MKLDSKAMRHLTDEDWRVLTAVETCSRNHELVPTALIERTARLRGGPSGVHKSISNLAKVGLIARVKEAKYDGYRLTYGGLDYLALHTHASRRVVYSVGTRIGVGKESDIMVVADDNGVQRVLKIHRLGRISFRTVKTNRDYLKKRRGGNASGSWMYLSRLAAMKEYAFMRVLAEEGFAVPEPLAQSRHTIVMSLIDAFPLRQVSAVPDPAHLYADLMDLILRLARHGLIHGDFNEFNILIKEDSKTITTATATPATPAADHSDRSPADHSKSDNGGENGATTTTTTTVLTPILIDFPQMVSMEHPNAEMYFDRDVECIKRFFERRFHFVSTEPGPFFKNAKRTVGSGGARRLDAAVEASGFTKKMVKDLEAAIHDQIATRGDNEDAGVDGDDDGNYSDERDDVDEDDEASEPREEDNVSSAPGAENSGIVDAAGTPIGASLQGAAEKLAIESNPGSHLAA